MAYVDYAYYQSLYGDSAIPEADFNRLSWDACREIDRYTTGIDGYIKLRNAFPKDEYAAESVRRCVCKLVSVISQIEQAEKSAQSSQGYIQREDGTVQGKIVTSVSAGNESISYSAGGSGDATAMGEAVKSADAREKMYYSIIHEYLSGIKDANGVNLLGRGTYPCCLRKE